MAYIELDKKKIARLRKEAQQFQDDIVCAVGTDFMETIAEAENRMIFDILNGLESEPTAGVVEVKHGKWQIEVHSFYADNFSEDTELVIYALAKCSCCGKVHNPHQVYSEHLYAPEDASYDFRFDQEYEKAKSLEKFKQSKYEFQNYCPHCGAKMEFRGE